MMRRLLPTIGAVVVAALLQAGLAPYMAIGGVVPNFLLLVVVTLALVEGPAAGCSVGFACGLIFDLLGPGPVGPMVLVLSVTGYLAGLLHENMFAEGWLLPITVLGDRGARIRDRLRADPRPARRGRAVLAHLLHQDAAGGGLQHGARPCSSIHGWRASCAMTGR